MLYRIVRISSATGLLLVALAGHAATFTVTTTADLEDAVPGDGICRVIGSTHCSLRAAVQEANASIATDAIRLPAGIFQLSRVGSGEDAGRTGDLDITRPVTIDGENAAQTIIDGLHLDRVFDIHNITYGERPEALPYPGVNISHVTVTNGSVEARGGGIRSDGQLVLRHARIVNNEALRGGGIADSGDYIPSSFTLFDVQVSGNFAGNETCTSGEGGGILKSRYASPIGITSGILDSTVEDNFSCGSGGGISFYTALRLVNSEVRNNAVIGSTGAGGGLILNRFQNIGDTSRSMIENTTIAGNSAPNGGGAVIRRHASILNSTISGNMADSGGAGIESIATLRMNNVTLARNAGSTKDAATVGWLHLRDASLPGGSSTPEIINSILAENTGDNCRVRDAGGLPFPAGVTAHSNLDDDASCGFGIAGAHPSIVGLPANLIALSNNGGLSRTHAVNSSSPAVNSGDDATCLTQDQRGLARFAACDMGAYERQPLLWMPEETPWFVFRCPYATGGILPRCSDSSWLHEEYEHPRFVERVFDCLADGPGCWEFGTIDWPATQAFELQMSARNKLSVQLFNAKGTLIASASTNANHFLSLKLPSLPTGLYHLKIAGSPTRYRMNFPTLAPN